MLAIKSLLIYVTIFSVCNCNIDWKPGSPGEWAFACDFFEDRDMGNAQIRGEDCSGRCAATSGCTHFDWTNYNGGTCWMKYGSVSKSNANYNGDYSKVCGVIPDGDDGGPRAAMLQQHNYYRSLHGCPPLQASARLDAAAQSWAEYLASTSSFDHMPNNPDGENLAMQSDDNAEAAVKAWYDEVEHYDYNNPGFSMQTGHFTQVVWCNSRQLGIGIAFNGGMAYIVARYSPPGNVEGQFEENVPRR